MEYKFRIPIGDWSGDGHSQSEYSVIQSNKPVEAVREAYFAAKEKLGYSLDGQNQQGPCSQWGEDSISNEEYTQYVQDGLLDDNDNRIVINQPDNIHGDPYSIEAENYTITVEIFLEMVLAFLQKGDPELVLLKIKEENLPILHFYGFDNQQRHIGYFGYGLFI